MVKVTIRSRPLSVIIILCFNLTWRDEMQIITKSSFVQWQNTIYITEAGSKDLGYYFLLSLWSFRGLWKTSAWHPCGINQLAVEHNLLQYKYQSLLKHPSTRLDKHVVDKKILTISFCLYLFFLDFLRFGIAFVKVRVLSTNDTIRVPLFSVLLWDVMLYQF
jgi:hypothetical protein